MKDENNFITPLACLSAIALSFWSLYLMGENKTLTQQITAKDQEILVLKATLEGWKEGAVYSRD